MTLRLAGTAFRQEGDIPQKYTCDGNDNISPPLGWSGAEGMHSFLLYCDDPDAPSETFNHWVAFDIPSHWRGLNEVRLQKFSNVAYAPSWAYIQGRRCGLAGEVLIVRRDWARSHESCV